MRVAPTTSPPGSLLSARKHAASEGRKAWPTTSFPTSTTIPASRAIDIGVREFMCVGAQPPFDHPHVYLDMGDADEKVCPYCSTLYRYRAGLGADRDQPARTTSTATSRPEPPGPFAMAGERRTIVVVGAGIGGLTAALALAAAATASSSSSAPISLSDIGAGIQIAPNAGRILARLGLDTAMAAAAIEPEAIDVMSGASGKLIASLPGAAFRAALRLSLPGHPPRRPAGRFSPRAVAAQPGHRAGPRRDRRRHARRATTACWSASSKPDRHRRGARRRASSRADGVWSTFREQDRRQRAAGADRTHRVARGGRRRRRRRPRRHEPRRPLARPRRPSRPLPGGAAARRVNIVAIVRGGVERGRLERAAGDASGADGALQRVAGGGARSCWRRRRRGRNSRSLTVDPSGAVVRRADRASRRRRPRHGAVSGAGRGDGDRGCGGARRLSARRERHPRRAPRLRGGAQAARRAGRGSLGRDRRAISLRAGPWRSPATWRSASPAAPDPRPQDDWIYRWRGAGADAQPLDDAPCARSSQ